jgi:hypothetical protein
MGCYTLDEVFNLGEIWFAAKPPSGRIARHSGEFFNLGENLFAAKLPSVNIRYHSEQFLA